MKNCLLRERLSSWGLCGLAVVGTLFMGTAATAESFPVSGRPVKLVVPTPAAGPLDFFARNLSVDLGKRWDVPVVVENKPGAGTALGTQAVARAPADGHTLLVANIAISAHGALSKAPLFDVEREFQPVSLIASAPYFLIVGEKSATSMEALVAQAKAQPGRLNFAIIPNSQLHLDTVRVLSALGIQATLVPYAGTAPIIRALLSGEVDAYVGTPAGMQPHFDAGKLRPLATTSGKPWPTFPNVPTLLSKGISLEIDTWYALFAPAGLSPAAQTRLRTDLLAVMQTPAFESKVREAGFQPRTSTAAGLGKMVGDNLRVSRELVRAHGIQPE